MSENATTPPDQTTADEPVRFDTRTVVLLRDDLPGWQRLNVTAFLASGLTARHGDLVGEAYADADGATYLPLLGRPVIVLEGDAGVLAAARTRALGRELPVAVFTSAMFSTGHDAANRAVVRAVAGDDLDLVGLAVHGPKNAVDKVVKGSHRHP